MDWNDSEDETWRLRTALHDVEQAQERQREACESSVRRAYSAVGDELIALKGERTSLGIRLATAREALTKIVEECADESSTIARWMLSVAKTALDEIGSD